MKGETKTQGGIIWCFGCSKRGGVEKRLFWQPHIHIEQSFRTWIYVKTGPANSHTQWRREPGDRRNLYYKAVMKRVACLCPCFQWQRKIFFGKQKPWDSILHGLKSEFIITLLSGNFQVVNLLKPWGLLIDTVINFLWGDAPMAWSTIGFYSREIAQSRWAHNKQWQNTSGNVLPQVGIDRHNSQED